MRTDFFFFFVLYFCIKSSIGIQGEVGWPQSALNPPPPPPTPVVYSTDRSKTVVPVLVLLFVALWFILRGDLFYLVFLCFCVAITSLGEDRANIGSFRAFLWFALVWFLSVSSASSCLGLAAAYDCGTPWTFPSTFLLIRRWMPAVISLFWPRWFS